MRIALLVLYLLQSSGCGREVAGPGSGSTQPPGSVVPYTGGSRIAWDFRTLRRPFDGPASYPRMIRLRNGDLLLSVESSGASHVLRSSDDGATWSAPIEVAAPRNGIIAAVPSLLQLESGTVLMAYNPRPPMNNADPARRFAIKLAASNDNGRTWQERMTVFQAGVRSTEGVWEPAMIQLPSGEILLFVANELPYGNSSDQEISMLRSVDEGRSWSAPETVSYRPGHRDGMPVPLMLPGGDGIALAIEDDGLVPGPFKPVIVQIPASGVLDGAVVGAESDRRWAALSETDRLPIAAYAGAPYLAQFPDGETLLSFQSNEGRQGDWSHSTMVVTIGTAAAKSFSRKSHPFRVPEGRRALWNSLFIKNDRTVAALTATTAYNSAHPELYTIDGTRIPEPRAYAGSITVDGDGSEPVWDQSPETFVGAYSDKVAWIRSAWDSERFYLRFEVLDGTAVETNGASKSDDALLAVLAPAAIPRNAPVDGVFRLRVEVDGAVEFDVGSEGSWRSADAAGILAQVSPKQDAEPSGLHGQRYIVEVGIPWARIGGRPEAGQGWGVSFGLVNNDGSGQLTREWVAGTDPDRPRSWMRQMILEQP